MLAASSEIADGDQDGFSWTENIESIVAMVAVVAIISRSVLYLSCTYDKKTQPVRVKKAYLKV